MTKWLRGAVAILVMAAVCVSEAAVPNFFNYQGRLVRDGAPVNGVHTMTFQIYSTPSGGAPLMVDSENVTVTDGLYSVRVGETPTVGTLDAAVRSGGTLYLEITVAGLGTLTPRERLGSACYAAMAGAVPDSAIENGMLANGSVTGAKIADGSVGNADLAANAVTGAKIADGSVSSVDLAANAVTSDRIADGAIANADLAANAVNGAKIADGSVGNADLAANAVTGDKNLEWYRPLCGYRPEWCHE